jgi:hypothetical protein
MAWCLVAYPTPAANEKNNVKIKSQDKNPRSQQSVNMLYFVLSVITTCFGLRKRPSLGDYHAIQIIKKKVTIRCNGSVESNSTIIG